MLSGMLVTEKAEPGTLYGTSTGAVVVGPGHPALGPGLIAASQPTHQTIVNTGQYHVYQGCE